MDVKIEDITRCLEQVAPLQWQESYDNAGLIVGNPLMVCTGVYVCLDVFASTIEDAINKGCNLIISHHPFIFHAIKKLEHNSEIANILSKALSCQIAIYSSHTNLDSASTGVSHMLAKKLGLENIRPLQEKSLQEENSFGCGAVADLPCQTSAKDFLLKVKQTLSLDAIRYCGDLSKSVKTIGLCGGAGAEFITDAIDKGCQIYLSADIKYHDFLMSEGKITVADIGHFESEQFILQRIIEIISKKFTNFAPLYISTEKNRVKFI